MIADLLSQPLLFGLALPAALAAAMILVIAGAIQGATGFGFNMLAAPVLAVIHPGFVPGAIICLASLVALGGGLSERRAIAWGDLGFALLGRMIAAGAAVAVMGLASARVFSVIFALAVLGAVALSLSGLRIPANRLSLGLAGALSGFMGTLTSIGAPPMALVYQYAPAAQMRATLNAFFMLGGAISLVALALGGRLGWGDLALAAAFLPWALLGLALSALGRGLVARGLARPLVLGISAASGLVLLARAL